MRDAVGKGVGLAGSGAGDDQQRRGWTGHRAMLDGAPLFRIKAVEVGGCRWHEDSRRPEKKSDSAIPAVRTTTSARAHRPSAPRNANRRVDSRRTIRTNQEQSISSSV